MGFYIDPTSPIDVGDMGAYERGKDAGRKWLEKHEEGWHIRPCASRYDALVRGIRERLAALGVVRTATLAEIRQSEQDPVRLLLGLRLGQPESARFEELASALLDDLRAAFPSEPSVEAGRLEEDAAPGPNPYRIFP